MLGDTVKIRLVSDGFETLYGFSLSDIVPYYDECLHSSTRLENEKSPTCGEEGYTGDLICNNCEAVLKKGDIIPATGKHDMEMTVYPPTCGERVIPIILAKIAVTVIRMIILNQLVTMNILMVYVKSVVQLVLKIYRVLAVMRPKM